MNRDDLLKLPPLLGLRLTLHRLVEDLVAELADVLATNVTETRQQVLERLRAGLEETPDEDRVSRRQLQLAPGTGHRDRAADREAVVAPAEERRAVSVPRGDRADGRRCSICNELGHRASNRKIHPNGEQAAPALNKAAAPVNSETDPGRARRESIIARAGAAVVRPVPGARESRPRPQRDLAVTSDEEDAPVLIAIPQPALQPLAPVPPVSRSVRRRRRRTQPRAMSIPTKKLTRAVLAVDAGLEVDEPRPVTRGDCKGDERPCPWVGCRHHLYLDINPETGSIKLNFPHLEPWEMAHSCSIDFAERASANEDVGRSVAGGGSGRFEHTLDEVGAALNITRERARQLEERALHQLRFRELADFEKYFPHPQQGGASS